MDRWRFEARVVARLRLTGGLSSGAAEFQAALMRCRWSLPLHGEVIEF